MIEKKTIVNSINATRFGSLEVQLGLLVVQDGTNELSSKWHRFLLDVASGAEVVDPQIDMVNVHLISSEIDWPPVSTADRERIRRHFLAELNP